MGGCLVPTNPSDHFAEDKLGRYAGLHLLLDMHGCDMPASLPRLVWDMVEAAGATILRTTHYAFPGNGGETIIALLAESHISIHSWPEHRFVAADIFMCGKTDADAARRVLVGAMQPVRVVENAIRRGEGVKT